MDGFHCPYCGIFHEDLSPEFGGGSVRCSCGEDYEWVRIISGNPKRSAKRYQIRMIS
jgi:hypothetical protein